MTLRTLAELFVVHRDFLKAKGDRRWKNKVVCRLIQTKMIKQG